MASKEVWENYFNPKCLNKGSDEDIQSMIADIVDLVHKAETIYGYTRVGMITRSFLTDYHNLVSIANARRIEYRTLLY